MSELTIETAASLAASTLVVHAEGVDFSKGEISVHRRSGQSVRKTKGKRTRSSKSPTEPVKKRICAKERLLLTATNI